MNLGPNQPSAVFKLEATQEDICRMTDDELVRYYSGRTEPSTRATPPKRRRVKGKLLRQYTDSWLADEVRREEKISYLQSQIDSHRLRLEETRRDLKQANKLWNHNGNTLNEDDFMPEFLDIFYHSPK